MQRRLLLNLSLAFAVAALAGWLLLSNQPPSDAQESVLVSDIDPDLINHITLIRPGKPDLILQRSGTDWRITSPIENIASPFRINSLLSLLQAHSISTVNAPLERLGLADADRPVTLTFNNHRFRFGSINPFDRSRYVEYAGIVHLVDDTLYPQLQQDAAFFADSAVVAPATEQTDDATLQGN